MITRIGVLNIVTAGHIDHALEQIPDEITNQVSGSRGTTGTGYRVEAVEQFEVVARKRGRLG